MLCEFTSYKIGPGDFFLSAYPVFAAKTSDHS